MTFEPDPRLVSLFGSATRVRVLATLANSDRPLTGYRIAAIAGIQPIKAYEELRRLAEAGWLRRAEEGKRWLWTINDSDVARLLRRRARVVRYAPAAEAYPAAAKENREILARYRKEPVDLRRFRSEPGRVRNRSEYERSPGKDEVLARLGLKVSSRAR